MKTKVLTIIIGMFLISLVSAITIYSGETTILELEKSYEYYSIVGNSSEINLNITQEGTIITITPDKYSQSDNFELIFFDKEKEIITVYSGGGGTVTKYVNKTEYKKIPTYIDREVIVEKEIEKEIPIETLIEFPKKVWILIGLMVIVITGLIIRLIYKKKQ